eukprot:CAMPEP_0170127950 /NCGR_PEP_ID=MMETSP0020_2-20130122/20825_1 /TAXON_ID=98059 /ORGANISM="Dinobryon sp., Strain UTEXLB2267" /LENGTH=77 /DNA_ID=CAMNT_0010361667 /DNA_START=290 /DNA_END=523 /DNA_ORIENTATION=+
MVTTIIGISINPVAVVCVVHKYRRAQQPLVSTADIRVLLRFGMQTVVHAAVDADVADMTASMLDRERFSQGRHRLRE